MTTIKFEDGKPTLRDGKVGTDSACCDQCCDGVIHTEPGDCCGDTWHPDADPDAPCPDGHIYLRWGAANECCGCVPATIFDGRVGEEVPTISVADILCCGCDWTDFDKLMPYTQTANEIPDTPAGTWRGCIGRCCTPSGGCANTYQYACSYPNTWTEAVERKYCCEVFGCPVWCCQDDGTCTYVEQWECPEDRRRPLTSSAITCAEACVGACCKQNSNGVWEPVTISRDGVQTTQLTAGECAAEGGRWQGPGTTGCEVGDCCDQVTSSASSLVFTPPDELACENFGTCGFSVTVTVRSPFPVCVHGRLMGGAGCEDKRTFVVCNGQVEVLPGPGHSTLAGADITICWADGSGPETIPFSCCGTSFILGNCDCSCVTTLLYEGTGCTSAASIEMRGDAVIDSSGTGALVLTTPNITQGGTCARKLTLAGTSTANNEITGSINNAFGGTSVDKDGPGLWRLSGSSTYEGQLRVLHGTLVAASLGAFGQNNPEPQIGSTTATSGTAALLVEGLSGVPSLAVPAGAGQQVVIGGRGASSSSINGDIKLGRDVVLQASTGGSVEFGGSFTDTSGGSSPAVAITVGSQGNAGTVIFSTQLPATLTGVNVVRGTARLPADGFDGPVVDQINADTPVSVGSSLGAATLDIGGTQTLSDLSVAGSSGSITSGTLRLTGTLAVTGTGHEISSAVALDAAVTISGDGALLISGVVSGANGITKSGTGTVRLSGANTYTGTTAINGGTMKAESLTAFGTGPIVVNAGGTLDKNGYALANTITNNGGTVLN